MTQGIEAETRRDALWCANPVCVNFFESIGSILTVESRLLSIHGTDLGVGVFDGGIIVGHEVGLKKGKGPHIVA